MVKDVKHQRCRKCNYIMGEVPYKQCSGCHEYYHDHCLEDEKKKKKQGAINDLIEKENEWKCSNCKSCAYCLSNENKDQMVSEGEV